MTQDQWQLWRSQWRGDGLQSVCDQSCTWLTSATTSYTAPPSHTTSSTAQTWSQHPDYNIRICPTHQQRHGLRRIDDLFEVMATFGIKLMGTGQGRTISACSTLLQTYARLIMWSTIGQNAYISASFKPFPYLPIMHNILAFYVLMVIHKVVSTILTRKRIIYQFSRMVASCS